MNKQIRFLVIVFPPLLVAGLLALYCALPLPISKQRDVAIPVKSSVIKAAQLVDEGGIVRAPLAFKWLLRGYCTVFDKNIFAGNYRFVPGNSHWQVIRSLTSGKQVVTISVTFPEGISSNRFASIVQKNLGVDSTEFMRLMFSDSMATSLGVKEKSLEGYLFPDTYNFFWKQPAHEIITVLVEKQHELWNREFAQQASSMGKSRHEVLTLASIVEAETPTPIERPRVAGVYTNRLQRGMKLDADPTVQYALGMVQRRLFYNDLTLDSPYNTYMKIGLPPGPINAPSESSIRAALHPEQNNYIFFCAKGDGSNTHSFAATSAEHLVNVATYRRNRSQR